MSDVTPAPPPSRALSPSRAADFLQCPLLYRFRVVDRIPEPTGIAATRGTLVHAVLERLFDLPAAERTVEAAGGLVPGELQRMIAESPEVAALVGRAVEGVEATEGVESGVRRDLPPPTETIDADTLLAEAVDLVERWFRVEDPTVLEPAEREMWVEADLDGLTIRGIVDRLDRAPDGRLRIVDYKTGRAPNEQREARALFQLRFYALALWRSRGVIPSRLQLVYPRDEVVLWIDPTEQELLATERKIRALWDAIETAATTGDWRPRRSFACRWCAHRQLCPEWGGTPPPLPQGAEVLALDSRAGVVPDDAEE